MKSEQFYGLPSGGMCQIIDSIAKTLFVLGDDLALYPGHGDDGDISTSRQEYTIFKTKTHAADLSGDVNWLKD